MQEPIELVIRAARRDTVEALRAYALRRLAFALHSFEHRRAPREGTCGRSERAKTRRRLPLFDYRRSRRRSPHLRGCHDGAAIRVGDRGRGAAHRGRTGASSGNQPPTGYPAEL